MMMEKHFWTLNIYNIITRIAIFSLASLIIIFTRILAVKKCKKQNKNTAIRIIDLEYITVLLGSKLLQCNFKCM